MVSSLIGGATLLYSRTSSCRNFSKTPFSHTFILASFVFLRLCPLLLSYTNILPIAIQKQLIAVDIFIVIIYMFLSIFIPLAQVYGGRGQAELLNHEFELKMLSLFVGHFRFRF